MYCTQVQFPVSGTASALLYMTEGGLVCLFCDIKEGLTLPGAAFVNAMHGKFLNTREYAYFFLMDCTFFCNLVVHMLSTFVCCYTNSVHRFIINLYCIFFLHSVNLKLTMFTLLCGLLFHLAALTCTHSLSSHSTCLVPQSHYLYDQELDWIKTMCV